MILTTKLEKKKIQVYEEFFKNVVENWCQFFKVATYPVPEIES